MGQLKSSYDNFSKETMSEMTTIKDNDEKSSGFLR